MGMPMQQMQQQPQPQQTDALTELVQQNTPPDYIGVIKQVLVKITELVNTPQQDLALNVSTEAVLKLAQSVAQLSKAGETEGEFTSKTENTRIEWMGQIQQAQEKHQMELASQMQQMVHQQKQHHLDLMSQVLQNQLSIASQQHKQNLAEQAMNNSAAAGETPATQAAPSAPVTPTT